MNRTLLRFLSLVGTAIVVAATASCDSGDGGEKTQVVARVNDAEITVTQLRAALLSKGEIEPSGEVVRRTLEGLVNEQLLVDSALRRDLDRDPAVVQAIEAARRQLLANAYVERVVFPKDVITAAEQAAYFRNHPELFAQRRVYQISVHTCARAELPEGLIAELDDAKLPDEVESVLVSHALACEVQSLTRAAEQLAFEQLPRFASAEIGDIVIQPQSNERTALMLITGIQNSPITFESAQPIIQQYLANMRNAEALDTHLAEARAGASITRVDASLVAASEREPSAPHQTGGRESGVESDGAAVLN